MMVTLASSPGFLLTEIRPGTGCHCFFVPLPGILFNPEDHQELRSYEKTRALRQLETKTHKNNIVLRGSGYLVTGYI